MDADQRVVLQAKLQELLKFLQKNQAAFFGAKHAPPPKEYLDWWEALEAAGGSDAAAGRPAADAKGGGAGAAGKQRAAAVTSGPRQPGRVGAG